LARLLADDPRLTLVIAGRSLERATAFCRGLPVGAETVAASFDRDADVEGALRAIAPALVVDATGPFQAYGDNPYRLVKSCLGVGVPYLDFADGADFVAGIGQFDAQARERDVFILSGVSSLPVLTAAAARELSRDLPQVHAITAGIAPSPYAEVGLNVIRAIASYAGKPVPLLRDGHSGVGYALIETLRYTIAPLGRSPLGSRRFSLVYAPDLRLLSELWPNLRSVWVGAAPVPEVLHRGLNALAWLVRLRLLPSLAPLAKVIHRVAGVLRWGEHRGGMFVVVTGQKEDGSKVARSWHLLAEGDDGPFIPSMAIAAIVRRILEGKRPASGARSAIRDVELADYAPLFARRAIYTGRREE
jgi:hypothetical protein